MGEPQFCPGAWFLQPFPPHGAQPHIVTSYVTGLTLLKQVRGGLLPLGLKDSSSPQAQALLNRPGQASIKCRGLRH